MALQMIHPKDIHDAEEFMFNAKDHLKPFIHFTEQRDVDAVKTASNETLCQIVKDQLVADQKCLAECRQAFQKIDNLIPKFGDVSLAARRIIWSRCAKEIAAINKLIEP